MAWLEKMQHPLRYIKNFLKWTLLGLLMGGLGGLIGAGFHHALHFVTHLRGEHTWLIFLLPLGGLLTVGIYRLLKLHDNKGTNEIIDAALHGHPVPHAVFPGIFLATGITHLFGGSAGREGAALQLGGSTGSCLANVFRMNQRSRKLMVMGGMAAVFAGLFGTPLTAMLFCMEFVSVGTVFSPALLPCFLASFTASRVSLCFGVHAEGILLENTLGIDILTLCKVAALAVALSALGIAMCAFFHKAEHFAHHHIPNPFVRIAVGGGVVLALTLMVGDHRFNGAGMDMALKAVEGETDWYNFLLKMVFTAVTLAAGFKGGEIVPTFCIGATFGCLLGGFLGLDAGVSGALGLIGLFCCATNSPIASIVLSIEMFGSANLYLFALVCVICFVLSGNCGLYASQIIQFDKADLKENHLERKR